MIKSYHEAVRDIAQLMVRVKNPTRLLKIITRFLYQEMDVRSTAIAIFDKDHARYLFYDSRGERRVPTSLIKLDADNALVKWFIDIEETISVSKDYLTIDAVEYMRNDPVLLSLDKTLEQRLYKIQDTMENLGARACFPGYYKKDLLGLVFVGPKRRRTRFTEVELLFLQTLASDASMAMKTAEYQQALERKVADLEQSLALIQTLHQRDKEKYLQTIITLAHTVDAKDAYTRGHSDDVEKLGMKTLECLEIHFSEERRGILSTALKLHDVGKLGVPDNILNKPGMLTPEEWLKMKEHVKIGAQILEHHDDFYAVAKIVLHHHENFDGTGYPYGLRGEEIPLESRIIAVVDSFHAMVSDRPYRKGLSYDAAVSELKKNIGTQFDGLIVAAFLRVLDKCIHVL